MTGIAIVGSMFSAAPVFTAHASASGVTPAATGSSGITVLKRGGRLNPGRTVRTPIIPKGPNGALSYYFELVLKSSGNLVEYQVVPKQEARSVYWQTATGRLGAARYVTLTDRGNLVVHDRKGNWSAGTAGINVQKLVMKNDGNLVLYTPSGTPKWASHNGICGKVGISDGTRSSLVSAGCRERGYSYCFGGGNQYGPTRGQCASGTVGFDCSGLSLYSVYQSTGILLSHSAFWQSKDTRGTLIRSRSNLLPGDIVFFHGTEYPHPSHVGIYLGKNYVVDAYDTGVPVQIHPFSSEYGGFVRARRFH